MLPRKLPILILLAAGCRAGPARALVNPPNVVFPTFGGLQLWSDTFWYQGWRIQRHAWTRHSRLLDPGNRRRAYGTRDSCKRVFDGEYRASARPLRGGRVVIMVHGLGRTRRSLASLDRFLASAGRATARVSYASTRAPLSDHADTLEGLLLDLPAGLRVDFVTHSLGGLVALEVLARPRPWRRLERGRLVQLAPPNRGSALAERAARVCVLRALLGPTLSEIARARGHPGVGARLELGIVAAVRGTRGGWNPFVPGDDDGLLGPGEAWLDEATDRLLVLGLHTFLMNDPAVQRAVNAFLTRGRFASVEPGGDDPDPRW